MKGKTVLVTGASLGIGTETAVALASMGALVVMVCRDRARGEAARDDVRRRSRSDAVELRLADLASLDDVRAVAGEFKRGHQRLDVLINNAGAYNAHRSTTKDGFETTFGVNHLGHFLLTGLLLDRLRESAPSRIVNVSSHAHKQARKGLDFDDLQSEQSYKAFSVYAKSKLANIYFTRELARRLDASKVTANALHPGFVASRFGRDGDAGALGGFAMVLGRPFAISPEKGARTSVWLASSPDVEGQSGGYYYKCKPSTPTAAARDDEAARRLWAASEELVGATSS